MSKVVISNFGMIKINKNIYLLEPKIKLFSLYKDQNKIISKFRRTQNKEKVLQV